MAAEESNSKPKETALSLKIGGTINLNWDELQEWKTFEEFKTNVLKFFSRLGMNAGRVLIEFSLLC